MDVPVKVHVRIKPPPLCADEGRTIGSDTVLKLSLNKLEFNEEKEFTFDHIYDVDCGQDEIFNNCAVPLLQQLLFGFNVTIMAYGPTGTGKSFTLGTSNTSQANTPSEGLLSRIISWIFSETHGTQSHITVSFLEIYKEELFDLLPSTQTKVEIKNDKVENVVMGNITEMKVGDVAAALKVIKNGNLRRQVKKTKSNDTSSRSHAIITVTIETDKDGQTRKSRIRLVDLAGSEAVAKDGVMGETKNEGIFINKGLLALGKVITALNSKNVSHIPHRESILTRALKDSLSGNSLTVLICCIKADFHSIAATSATLQFAAKARALKTRILPTPFKTPFKSKPPTAAHGLTSFKTPLPVKTTAKTPLRTPLAPIQLPNKVTTPGGSTFSLPVRMETPRKLDELDESVLVSSSYGIAHSKCSGVDDIENRIQSAVMGRVDAFLEELRDRLSQSFVSSRSRSLLHQFDATVASVSKSSEQTSPYGLDASLNLTMPSAEASTLDHGRRRSARLAEKRLTLFSNAVPGKHELASRLSRPRASVAGTKRSALALPTPTGKSKEHMNQYKQDMLHYLNHASQSQIQKLPSIGPKAGHCIITYRNVEGVLGDLETLKLVPGLRKNFYESFMKVGQLSFPLSS